MLKFAFQTVSSLTAMIAAMAVMIATEKDLTIIEGGMLAVIMIAAAGYFACTVIDMIQRLKTEHKEFSNGAVFSHRECRMVGKTSK